ncbi:proline/glycine betaine ABC transporter permease [Bacillus shivajii]|uniref:ABC transporter permease n=1 Tax=Bacillus shivajii TaxID=1983719 RepID=UPI001CFAA4B7|nr:proline/glycine betaine ABC transporter permease [Bacillus shivajii]UCZ53137.1 proline/glycine betaine ABC transporter permease [Bacillus shivajii]
MFEFPETLRLDLGIYVDHFINWITDTFAGFFDGLGSVILWFMLGMENILVWIPWFIIIAFVIFISWRILNPMTGIIFGLLLMLIGSFGYWELMMSTLAIVLTAVVISLIFGVPVGIWMAYNDTVERFVKPILDLMQTMPSFVYLIPAVMLFSLGLVPGVFATVIYAIPPVIRLTNLAIRRVSKDMIEASHSFGSSSWQTLKKVQLPQALPTIMTGINQTTMMALAMVVIASMVGARGLGMEVLIAINQLDIAQGFEAGISIVILAIIIDRLSQGIAERYKYAE